MGMNKFEMISYYILFSLMLPSWLVRNHSTINTSNFSLGFHQTVCLFIVHAVFLDKIRQDHTDRSNDSCDTVHHLLFVYAMVDESGAIPQLEGRMIKIASNMHIMI